MTNTICVGMGEIAVCVDPETELVCLGLGSCVAICLYDARRRVAAMAHVVLPSSPNPANESPGKYATTAIPLLLDNLRQQGVRITDLRAALVGGASIFPAMQKTMDIGNRNVQAVRLGLHQARVNVMQEESGGRESRTVRLQVATGCVRLRTVRAGDRVLAELGARA